MTLAIVGGAAAALLVLFILQEMESARLARGAARAVGVSATPRPRVPALDVSELWARLSAGELPLRTIQLAAALTLILFVAGLTLRSLAISTLAVVLAIVVGYAWTQRRHWTLAARVERDLPGAMTVMANALSAGGTVFQALETAAKETPAPLGRLLQEAASHAELTTTVEGALADLSARVGSPDATAIVAAMRIQRVTGGNLARLLREAAEFLQEEQRLRADARALSAQARYSAQMIGAMPAVLFALFYALFPTFIRPLTSTSVGLLILSYCLLSTAFGFYLIWRIAVAIERA